jgi:hypothetical protein
MKRFLTTILFTLLLAQSAIARPLTAPELAQITQDFAKMQAMNGAQSALAAVDLLPPKLIAKISGLSNTTPQDFRKQMAEGVKATLEDIEFLGFNIDTSDLEVRGKDPQYIVVKTETLLRSEGQKYQIRNVMFGVLEAGNWYFVAGNKRQMKFLYDLYPDLEAVEYEGRETTEIE